MKNKYLRTTIVMFIGFTIISKIGAQDSGNTEMKPFEIERESIKKSVTSLRTAFSKMFSTAKFVDKKGTGSCKPEDLVGKISIDGLISDNKNLIEEFSSIKDAYLGYPSHLRDAPSREEAYSFDTRNYKSMEDGALSSFSNTTNFADFVKIYTGADVGELDEFDMRTVRGQYENLKANKDLEFYIETEEFMSLSCSHEASSYIKMKKLDYPNATWVIRTVITADCDCSIASELTKNIQSGSIEYIAETTGLITKSAITFEQVKNAKVTVGTLICCPVIEEESKTTLNDPKNDDKGDFQLGAYAGLPFGDEKDFYSLNIGVEATYLFNLSEYFSAGIGVGYTHFTPKEFTVGSSTFKGEGIGYAPVFAAAQYRFSEKINVGATLGYALSTDSDVDGGLYCDVSFGWEAIPNYTIRPRIQFINLGDDRNFNSFGIGVSRSF